MAEQLKTTKGMLKTNEYVFKDKREEGSSNWLVAAKRS